MLAAFALLFVLGVQVQEAGHTHGADDAIGQCVFCKSSPGTAAVSLRPPLPPVETGPAPVVPDPQTPVLSWDGFPLQARGPPEHS